MEPSGFGFLCLPERLSIHGNASNSYPCQIHGKDSYPVFFAVRLQNCCVSRIFTSHTESLPSSLPRTETKGRDEHCLLTRAKAFRKILDSITVAVLSLKSQKIN